MEETKLLLLAVTITRSKFFFFLCFMSQARSLGLFFLFFISLAQFVAVFFFFRV